MESRIVKLETKLDSMSDAITSLTSHIDKYIQKSERDQDRINEIIMNMQRPNWSNLIAGFVAFFTAIGFIMTMGLEPIRDSVEKLGNRVGFLEQKLLK